MVDEYLTVLEAAQILKMSARTLQRWCQERRIPHYDFGFSYRLKRSELEEWISHRYKQAR